MNATVMISVAVLVHQEENQLVQRCLRALDTEVAAAGAELLVVCSPARGTELTEVLGSRGRLLRCANHRVGARRALAVQEARGKLIAFTDADCVVQPGWLGELSNRLTATDWAAGSFGITRHELGDSRLYRAAQQAGLLAGFELAKQTAAFDWAPCSNVMYRRDAVLAAGNFDVTRMVAEDVDLGLRLKAVAGPLVAAPRAVVKHSRDEFTDGIWRRAWYWGRGDADLMIDHPSLAHLAPPPRWLWWTASVLGAALISRSWRQTVISALLWSGVGSAACLTGGDPRSNFLSRRITDVFGIGRAFEAWRQRRPRLAFSTPIYGPGHAREVADAWAKSAREGVIGMALCLVIATMKERP